MAIQPMKCEKIVCMSWSPDSKYLAVVVETKSSNFSGVTIDKEKQSKELHPSRPEEILKDKEN
jgi:hypothetical protein